MQLLLALEQRCNNAWPPLRAQSSVADAARALTGNVDFLGSSLKAVESTLA